ncbi:MvdC/MvdD family ATP grasp protein [Streptomyces sp. NPDC006333]|uniref:MvdC/MvdD family ATP grasp protein n=1 Tax=Streptomyces sp. NPDC006333 TaxID=3156753 RepID=UPI0033B10818
MSKHVLIVTAGWDMTALVGAEALHRRGHRTTIVRPDEIPEEMKASTLIDDAVWSTRLKTKRGQVDLATFDSVWWRKPLPPRMHHSLNEIELAYAERETQHYLKGIWALMTDNPEVFWMSHPRAIQRAENKLLQLKKAAEAGFDHPKTLITNDPEAVHQFYAECDGQMVFKSLSGGFIVPGQVVDLQESDGRVPVPYVRPVSQEDLEHLDRITHNPCQFQELVDKHHELRITVFGERAYAAGLYSQDDERTRFDSRMLGVKIRTTVEKIPAEIEAKCLRLMSAYGLEYAAFDFIVTPDGDYVFLEMNPNGQWLYIQEWVPELKLLDAFADVITGAGRLLGD